MENTFKTIQCGEKTFANTYQHDTDESEMIIMDKGSFAFPFE